MANRFNRCCCDECIFCCCPWFSSPEEAPQALVMTWEDNRPIYNCNDECAVLPGNTGFFPGNPPCTVGSGEHQFLLARTDSYPRLHYADIRSFLTDICKTQYIYGERGDCAFAYVGKNLFKSKRLSDNRFWTGCKEKCLSIYFGCISERISCPTPPCTTCLNFGIRFDWHDCGSEPNFYRTAKKRTGCVDTYYGQALGCSCYNIADEPGFKNPLEKPYDYYGEDGERLMALKSNPYLYRDSCAHFVAGDGPNNPSYFERWAIQRCW